jgi:acyl phosphate:glycerol-3-phosphate acyltransferase
MMESVTRISFFCLPVFAYLLGSIPWGVVFTRVFFGIDIRGKGSGNIGATNVGRVAGMKLGLLTLFADAAKGALPVWLAILIGNPGGWPDGFYPGLVASGAFLGHLYPCFLGFNGGKGVSTAAGCFLVISPVAVFISAGLFLFVSVLTKRASTGSLASAAILPLLVWITRHNMALTACAAAFFVLIAIRHKDNIRRILSGTEPRFRIKKG